MSRIDKLARDYIRTAGKIEHVRDTSNSDRQFVHGHKYRVDDYKTLAKTLWQITVALGHVTSATTSFSKLKSFHISPDGVMGGKGYIKSVKELRNSLTTIMNTLSETQDTLYDELKANHWQVALGNMSREEAFQISKEVDEVIDEVDDIQADPEGFADDLYLEDIDDASEEDDTQDEGFEESDDPEESDEMSDEDPDMDPDVDPDEMSDEDPDDEFEDMDPDEYSDIFEDEEEDDEGDVDSFPHKDLFEDMDE